MVINNEIVSIGYNGSAAQQINCSDTQKCIRSELGIPSGERLDLCVAVHAEINAIRQAERRSIGLQDATLYITTQPCKACAEAIKLAGIKNVVYVENYNQGG